MTREYVFCCEREPAGFGWPSFFDCLPGSIGRKVDEYQWQVDSWLYSPRRQRAGRQHVDVTSRREGYDHRV